MPLLVSRVEIESYRSIRDTIIEPHQPGLSLKDFTVLIGRNNTGKSNLLAALQLLFEGTTKELREEDFHVQGGSRANGMSITVTLTGVQHYLPLLAKEHRAKIEGCVENDLIRIRRVASRANGLKLEKKEIWQPQKGEFGLPTGIENALNQILPEVIYIEAFKDPTSEAVGKSSATLGKLLNQIVKAVESAVRVDMEKAFESARPKLNVQEKDGKTVDERTEEIKLVENLIKRHMAAVFEKADVRLEFTFPDVSSLFTSAAIKTKDQGVWTSPGWQGQGFQRMLYFALLRTLADMTRAGGQAATRPFLLLFEEPEAFLHPALQRLVSDALEEIALQNQVIIATHSPLVVTPARLENVVFARMDEGTRFYVPTLESADSDDKQLGRLLTLTNSAEFLVADHVLVVEGISDRTIFDAVWSHRKALKLPDCNLAVIDCGSKDCIGRWCKILRDMGIRSYGTADLDFLWRGAGTLLGGDETLSKFCQEFWKLAGNAGIAEDSEGKKKIKEGERKRAFELIESNLKNEKASLRDELRSKHSVWILEKGEIEDYFGLSQRSKDRYTRVAQEIRAGSAVPASEIVDVLKWASSP